MPLLYKICAKPLCCGVAQLIGYDGIVAKNTCKNTRTHRHKPLCSQYFPSFKQCAPSMTATVERWAQLLLVQFLVV